MIMGQNDDVLVAGMNSPEMMGNRWFRKFARYTPQGMLYNALARKRRRRMAMLGENEYMGSWLSSAFNKIKGGAKDSTITMGPQGFSFMKPPSGLPGGSPGAASGIMDMVKNNPIPFAIGAGAVLLLVMRKK